MANRIKNPRLLVSTVLQRVEDGAYSNIALDAAFQGAALSDSDKRLATRIFYGTLSNLRLIDTMWESMKERFIELTDPFVRATLRAALYQLRYLDRVPPHAVIKESVEVAKKVRGQKAANFCNALLRKISAHAKDPLPTTGDALRDFAIQESLSDDLAQLLWQEYGAEVAKQIAQSFNEIPKNSLRVNLSQGTIEQAAARLGAQRSQVSPTGLVLEAFSVEVKEQVNQGFCSIQDEGSQLVALALGAFDQLPRPDAGLPSIWDACAGQGGKAMQLFDIAASEHCDTQMVCTDLYEAKLQRLRDAQRERFPKQRLYTRALDLSAGGSISHAPFSGIILDAPCSGLGVLRRHPEGKWNKSLAGIQSVAQLQKSLLHQVSKHLRIGGVLVYAVCTITKAETSDQIADFLEQHQNFKLCPLPASIGIAKGAETLQILPQQYGCDGFFMARLTRIS